MRSCANGVKCVVIEWVRRSTLEVVWPHGKDEE